MSGGRSWMRFMVERSRFAAAILLGALGCAGSNGTAGVVGPPTDPAAHDAAVSDAAATEASADGAAIVCPAPSTGDPCSMLPSGSLSPCSRDSAGQPSQTGYMEILGSDGSREYVCATSWVPSASGGYYLGHPDQFTSDPQSCCGGNATPAPAPMAAQPAAGYFGALHAAHAIKPQESLQPGEGALRQNPFAIVVTNRGGAAALTAALASWHAWAGDHTPHPGPDGSGAYYFPAGVLINYDILETTDGQLVVVIGPEVSLTADGAASLGHPTLGACANNGGAPLALMAGELSGTTLNNHSGRFGHDPSVTPQALDNAAALFNCLGIPITATSYYPPMP